MVWKQTGTSSNITFYQDDVDAPRNLWAEVLADNLEKADGKWRARKVCLYVVWVNRTGIGRLGEFRYSPKTNAGLRLPARTVARLIKEHGYL